MGDSGRMEIQQNFLKAVIQQLLKPANVLNIGKIAKVFDMYRLTVDGLEKAMKKLLVNR